MTRTELFEQIQNIVLNSGMIGSYITDNVLAEEEFFEMALGGIPAEKLEELISRSDNIEDFLKLIHEYSEEFSEMPNQNEEINELIEMREKHLQSTRTAVEDVLLPQLPADLANLSLLGDDVTPLSVFLATDAVAIALHSIAEFVETTTQFELWKDNTVRIADRIVASENMLVQEISQVAKIKNESAKNMLLWMRKVARIVPKLFLGIDSLPLDCDRTTFTLTDEARTDNLYLRWGKIPK